MVSVFVICVNSLLTGVQKEVEPFDFSLQEQVRKLYQEVEEETINLTNLRRTTPQSLKKTYEDTFNQSMERLTQLQAEIEAAEEEHESPNDHGAKFSLLKPRLEDMITEYSQSIREIKEIKDVCIFLLLRRSVLTTAEHPTGTLRTGEVGADNEVPL